MTQQNKPEPEAAVVDGIVGGDFPCRRCGDNLRGLPRDGKCPECNAPAEISISNDLLRYSEPTYLHTLRRGIHLIFLGIITGFVAAILTVVLFRSAGASPLGALVRFAAAIPDLVGSWMLTAPDPSGVGESRYGTIRRTIRYCIIAGAADSFIDTMLGVGSIPHATLLGFKVLSILVEIAKLVGQIALLAYLSQLAIRIPDDNLGSRSRSLQMWIGSLQGIMLVASVLLGFMQRQPRGPWMVLGCAGGIAWLVLLVLYINYLFMLGKFATRFREEGERSRLLWAIAAEKVQKDAI